MSFKTYFKLKFKVFAFILVVSVFSTWLLANERPHMLNLNCKNTLLEKWQGPYGGVPPFDQVKVSEFATDIENAMTLKRAEIDSIANNPAPANFENTLLALEKAGQELNRVLAVFSTWGSSKSTDEFRAIEQTVAPKLAAFGDELTQNKKLFERIEAVYLALPKSHLTSEQKRLVELNYAYFVWRGAKLTDAQKKSVADINQRLALLETQFGQNLEGDEGELGLVLEQSSQLEGLPQSLIDGAHEEAVSRGLEGKWFIANTRSAMEPFLTYSVHRELRERAFRLWAARGDSGNARDNNKIISEIHALRQQRSQIMGFQSYAHWQLANNHMAKMPQMTLDLMLKVWQPAVAQVKKDVAVMQKLVQSEGGQFQIEPWDYRFYAEKVRKANYDFDFDVVTPYLQLDNIREAMFLVAKKLFGFTFKKIEGVPVFHETMSVYEVLGSSGQIIGVWYFDPFARKGKRSGAWMTSYRDQNRIEDPASIPLVSNNSNFIAGRPGEPVLISWDDAITMFHEFGHALHGLSSNVVYPSLAGTNTALDYVEFPSQVMENYLKTAEVLSLLKNKEGQTMPQELIDRINQTRFFNKGFDTVEYLASAIVDMKLHLNTSQQIDAAQFERTTLAEIGMPREIVMRHRLPQFNHLFTSEGYAAGYYGYLWAEVLAADAFEAFVETGNAYDPNVARKLYENIFSVGGSIDPSEAYIRFRGRAPNVNALLRARGFPADE